MKGYIYSATLPVQMDGPNAPPTQIPITILAEDLEQAIKQAGEAGLVLIGQLDTEGNLMK
jgi:hypothetical protein